jgi:hypothetical protein
MKQELNERMTQVGPGTAMGEVFAASGYRYCWNQN